MNHYGPGVCAGSCHRGSRGAQPPRTVILYAELRCDVCSSLCQDEVRLGNTIRTDAIHANERDGVESGRDPCVKCTHSVKLIDSDADRAAERGSGDPEPRNIE